MLNDFAWFFGKLLEYSHLWKSMEYDNLSEETQFAINAALAMAED